MSLEKIEQGYQFFFHSVEKIQKSLNCSFLDAYIETAENILDGNQVRVVDNVPDKKTVEKLETIYRNLKKLNLSDVEMRKVVQFVLLKVSLEDKLQPNHHLTPDTIGFVFTQLITILFPDKERKLNLLDVSVGTGNLLLTILLELDLAGYQVRGTGIDLDDSLLAVASANSSLVNSDVELFLQDSIQPLLVNPVDIVIGDLPVGYYPSDERAKAFTTSVSEGHSYAHHLLLEQGMSYVKETGWGLFLLPSNFLESEQSVALKEWLENKVSLEAIIHLSKDLFKAKNSQKSLVLFRNKEHSYIRSEVLLAEMPSLKNKNAIIKFFEDIVQWNIDKEKGE